MLAPFKAILFAFAIILIMLFSTGIIKLKGDGYACIGGWETGFQDRVEIVHYGPLHLYAFPFKRECPTERRYDPKNVKSCIDTEFCRATSDESLETQRER